MKTCMCVSSSTIDISRNIAQEKTFGVDSWISKIKFVLDCLSK